MRVSIDMIGEQERFKPREVVDDKDDGTFRDRLLAMAYDLDL